MIEDVEVIECIVALEWLVHLHVCDLHRDSVTLPRRGRLLDVSESL